MQKRGSAAFAVVGLLGLIAAAVLFVVLVRRSQTAPTVVAPSAAGMPGRMGAAGTPGRMGALGRAGRMGAAGRGGSLPPGAAPRIGVISEPSREPSGLLIKGFSGPPDPSPLKLMGVKEGDIIVSCNGVRGTIRTHFPEALNALQARGEPITLEVVRGGKTLTLKRTEKFHASEGATAGK